MHPSHDPQLLLLLLRLCVRRPLHMWMTKKRMG